MSFLNIDVSPKGEGCAVLNRDAARQVPAPKRAYYYLKKSREAGYDRKVMFEDKLLTDNDKL
jgi:hypothetical protein